MKIEYGIDTSATGRPYAFYRFVCFIMSTLKEINEKFSSLPAGSSTLESDFRDFTLSVKTKSSKLRRELITAMCRVKHDKNLYLNVDMILKGM